MKRRSFYITNQHNLLLRLAIFVLSVFFIVLTLPDNYKFSYDYKLGQEWEYADYYAPFSVPINKTPQEISSEQAELSKLNKPVYEYNDIIINSLKLRLFDSLSNFLRVRQYYIPESYLERINQQGIIWLDSLYKKGIITETPGIKIPELIIEIRDGKALEVQPFDFFSKTAALEYISTQLSGKKDFNNPALRQFFEGYITENIIFNEKQTRDNLQSLINNVSLQRGMIHKGALIIEKGEKLSLDKLRIIDSIKAEYEALDGSPQDILWLKSGQTLTVTVLLGLLLYFLIILRKDLFADAIKLSFLFSLIVATIVISLTVIKVSNLSIYILPYCVLPIIIRAFFDTRLALYVHLITILIIGLYVPDSFRFILIQTAGGMACIFSIVNLRKRSRLFFTITIIFFASISIFTGLTLLSGEKLFPGNSELFLWLAISAALTLFAYPAIYLIEKVFGFTSDVLLLELSDTNNPLLKMMALKAPGTFQHSLQVANLAEAAVYAIGGDSLLVRTGALYHDIGKIDMALYFIENQATGLNPHDELDFDESTRIILNHVKRGVQLGRKYKLPEQILDFIRTHHGTTRVQYFYLSFLKNYPESEIDENAFRYPGPTPYSRETAVVMMADAVEATSRSLKNINGESIHLLVERIINEQIADNQFINADITFKDITEIKKIFKKMLMNIYHVRIEYPH